MPSHVVFVPGYRLYRMDEYGARISTFEAIRGIPDVYCDEVVFPQDSFGNYRALPDFDSMVQITSEFCRRKSPAILVGHCAGAAVAVEVARQLTPLPSVILLCPSVSFLDPGWGQHFRILGFSTGIPKKFFVSKDCVRASRHKKKVTDRAEIVFRDMWTKGVGVPSSAMLTADHDRLCHSGKAEKLASALGVPHYAVDDNHALSRGRATLDIRAAVVNLLSGASKPSLSLTTAESKAAVPTFT